MTESKPLNLAERILSKTSAITLSDSSPEEQAQLSRNLRFWQRWNALSLLIVLALLIAAYGPEALEKARKGPSSPSNPPAENSSPSQNPLDAGSLS